MEITVNLDNLDLNTVIGQSVVIDSDGDPIEEGGRTIGDAVIDALVAKLYASVRSSESRDLTDRIRNIRDEEIRAQIVPTITEALSKDIQQTNSYGEPVGRSTTLNELIVKQVNTFLVKGTDDYRKNERLVDKIVREAIETAIKGELAAAIADEKTKVVAAVRAKAAELIADAVKQGIGR
jgi:hypothetical protein